MIDNNCVKKIFKSNPFKLSDLFLLLWGFFGILIFIEQNKFITYSSPNSIMEFTYPFYCFLIFFVLSIVSITVYLILEMPKFNGKKSFLIPLIFIMLITSQAENIFLTNDFLYLYIFNTRNDIFIVSGLFSLEIKCLHFFAFFFLITTFFIGIFVFPKRINNLKVIKYSIYVLYTALVILFIVSLIMDDYYLFFNALFGNNTTSKSLKELCPTSIFGNPNIYGMFLEVCLFLSLINYSITKKHFNLIFTCFSFINLLFTLCRAGIIASIISFILLYVIYTIHQFKNKASTRVRLVVIGLIIISVCILAALSITVFGFPFSFAQRDNLSGRKSLWYSSIQIIEQLSFVHGGGFGIYNTLMTSASNNYEIFNSSITHNWFLALMGIGGIMLVVPYIFLLIYALCLVITNYRNNKNMAPFGCAILSFFIHSFFEDNYYLVVAFIVILLTYLEASKRSGSIIYNK